MTLEEARENAKLSLSEMAIKMGMIKQTYSLKEKYQRKMTADELMRFCDITKTKPSQLKIMGYNL